MQRVGKACAIIQHEKTNPSGQIQRWLCASHFSQKMREMGHPQSGDASEIKTFKGGPTPFTTFYLIFTLGWHIRLPIK